MFPFDLHVHSHFSPDADQPPDKLFARAKARGLQGMILADHNTVNHLDIAAAAAADNNIATMEAIEISSLDAGCGSVHILGYSKNFDRANLMAGLDMTNKILNQRARTIVEKLREEKIADIDFNDVLALQHGTYVGRHQIGQVLAKVKNISYIDAFKFIDWNGPAFIPYPPGTITPESAVELIVASGGTPVLAHPASFFRQNKFEDAKKIVVDLLASLVPLGLSGIEITHMDTDLQPGIREFLIPLAEKYNLLITGGSDWHSDLFTNTFDLGDWGVDEKTFNKLQELH